VEEHQLNVGLIWILSKLFEERDTSEAVTHLAGDPNKTTYGNVEEHQ